MTLATLFLALFVCSVLFAVIFVLCAYGALRLIFEHVSIVGFGGGSSWSPHETALFGLCSAGLLASFLIHPYGAYLVSDTVRQLTSSETGQLLILVIFGSFQIILLTTASTLFAVREYLRNQSKLRIGHAHNKLILALEQAKVDVAAPRAKIISDDGKFVLAEVTLQIKNVPFSLPYYEMNIHGVGSNDRFFTAAVRQTNQSISNPYLKISSKAGKWCFYDIFTKRVVSDDQNEVVLQFEFSRVKAEKNELPDTITPRLGIWARDDKLYANDHRFFYKPIPVCFERRKDLS